MGGAALLADILVEMQDFPMMMSIKVAEAVEQVVADVDALVATQHEQEKSLRLFKILGGAQHLAFLCSPGRHLLFHMECQVRTHKSVDLSSRDGRSRAFKDALLVVCKDLVLLARRKPSISGRRPVDAVTGRSASGAVRRRRRSARGARGVLR